MKPSRLLPARTFPGERMEDCRDIPRGGDICRRTDSGVVPHANFYHQMDDVMVLNGSTRAAADGCECSILTCRRERTTFAPAVLSHAAVFRQRRWRQFPCASTSTDVPECCPSIRAKLRLPCCMPLPDPTFTVNRFDDPVPAFAHIAMLAMAWLNDCSLREAIIKANATDGHRYDPIVPAGTYTLTQPRVAAPQYNALTGTLNIN